MGPMMTATARDADGEEVVVAVVAPGLREANTSKGDVVRMGFSRTIRDEEESIRRAMADLRWLQLVLKCTHYER